MKVTPKRSFFAGLDADGNRINYERGKTYDLPEKTVQQFAKDFITNKDEVAKVADKETADSKAAKGKKTADA